MEKRQDSTELEITKIERSGSPGYRKYEIRWTVFNYSRLKTNVLHTMRSIIIQKKIRLLNLLKEQDIDETKVNLVLSLTKGLKAKTTHVAFCIMGKNSRIIKSSKSPAGLPLSFQRQGCFEESPDIIVNDTLTVLLTIKLYGTDGELSIFESTMQRPNFRSLLDSGVLADLKIIAGERTFLAHKAILCARSSSFETMFNTKDTENLFRMDCADPEAVQEMLNYLYTDETGRLNLKLALNLFQLANEYELEGLKFKAVSFLMREMSMDYAMKSLLMADRYSHVDLEHFSTKYIAKNLVLAKQHDDWTSFGGHKRLYDAVERCGVLEALKVYQKKKDS